LIYEINYVRKARSITFKFCRWKSTNSHYWKQKRTLSDDVLFNSGSSRLLVRLLRFPSL